MLTLILVESALERIPKRLWTHPSVKAHSRERRKPAKLLLLDRSYHHFAMKKLKENGKKGRPDIVHFTLLEALSSVLNNEELLQIYVHTNNNYVITVNAETRLPRNYHRFTSLLEQLFEVGRVPPKGETLLRIEHKTLPQLLSEVEPDYVLGFSRKGSPKTLEEAVLKLSEMERPAVIIGGFPRGYFSDTTLALIDELVCIDREMLETWTLTSRVIYEYECLLSLPQKRLR